MTTFLTALLFSFFLAGSVFAQQTEMGNATYLRKLTGFIAGRQPTPNEFEALEKAQQNPEQVSAFFNQFIDQLLASPAFADKMTYNLSELFQVRTPWTKKAYRKDVLTNLFHSINRNNLSWDQLLTSTKHQSDGYFYKPYRSGEAYNPEDFKNNIQSDDRARLIADRIFLSPLKHFQLDDQRSESDFRADPLNEDFTEDPRFAGAITTSRFLARFGNSALNKNRRRAAAIFRIFLCDPMAAVIPDNSENLESVLDQVFPNKSKTEQELKSELKAGGDSLHGTQADCMACHFKLDPAGRTLLKTGDAISTVTGSGALSFRRKSGELVNQPVDSIGALAKAISKQPEYLSCQVSHFWNWFVGRDVKMSEQKAKYLFQLFEKSGRRPVALVKALVTSTEFKATAQASTPLKSLALQAKALLLRCDTCHNSKNGVKTDWDEAVPSLTQWPIGGTSATTEYWVRTIIAGSLDLNGKAGVRSMPPKTSPWQPSAVDLRIIREWIEAGTPDESGTPMTKGGRL